MSLYLLDALPARGALTWILTADPNKRHGGLLTAIDHEGNRYYVDEHYAEGLPDSQHAVAYKRMLTRHGLKAGRDVEIWADPGGAGSQAIINLAEHGLAAGPVKKDPGSVKASIELIRRAAWVDPNHPHPVERCPLCHGKGCEPCRKTGRRMGAPHCYFLRSLMSTWKQDGVTYHESRLMWELRQYRQKEGGKPDEPVKVADDLVDCMRYVELVRPFSPTEPDTAKQEARSRLDSTSRDAQEEFDRLVAAPTGKSQTEKGWSDE